MATAMLLTISEEPLAQVKSRTFPRNLGRTKYSVPLRFREK